MLRFQAQRCKSWISPATLASETAVEVIGRVKLHSRFCAQHFQHPAAGRFLNPGVQAELSGRFVYDKILVVALGLLKLRVVGMDTGADGSGFTEIKRRA